MPNVRVFGKIVKLVHSTYSLKLWVYSVFADARVIHTPGHTTDHVALILEEENGVLFSGDTILGEGTAVFDDLLDYINSLKKIQSQKPQVIYPGHGPVIENPNPVIEYYIAHRQARENEILKVLQTTSQPMSATDIVKCVYPGLDKNLCLAAENNVKKHLVKLLKEKRVLYSDDKWQVV